MKNKFKFITAALFIMLAQLVFSQAKSKDVKSTDFKFSATKIMNDSRGNISTFTGDVSLSSGFLTFENAEKVVWNKETDEMKIYKPKNLKIISIEALQKGGFDKNSEILIYHPGKGVLEI